MFENTVAVEEEKALKYAKNRLEMVQELDQQIRRSARTIQYQSARDSAVLWEGTSPWHLGRSRLALVSTQLLQLQAQ